MAAIPLDGFASYLKDRVRPNTARAYLYNVQRWHFALNGELPTREAAQSYVNSLAKEVSPNTVNLAAHSIIKWFEYQGQDISLDCPSVPAPKPKYLTLDEVKKLISCCRLPLEKALVVPLFDTGVRISELLNLKVADIDWSNGFIKVCRKGGREDQVNISDKALAMLRIWLSDRQFNSNRVFGSLSYYEAWQIIKKAGNRAGLNVHPHMLRHSRAVMMLKAKAKPHIVQQHLGHRNIATTMNIYGLFTAGDLKEEIPGW